MSKFFKAFLYTFPVQLVFHHIRRNLALVILWVLFILSVSGGIGKIYGIHYLYLDPEYMNKVGFWSFFLVGLAFANFTMAFHITSYILDGHRFPFVGILERPFTKFVINNSLLPLMALVIYIVLIVRFQLNNEFTTGAQIFGDIAGLLVGIAVMVAFVIWYFKLTNKDIFLFMAGAVDKRLRKARLSRERMMNKLVETRARKYTVHSYLDLKLRWRKCDYLQDFYDKEAVLKVFDQNHFNSVIIEVAIIVIILLLGSFMENPYVQMPAAASSLLLFSILVMLIGAFSYWLRGWGLAFVFALFLVANFLVSIGVVSAEYQARGLDYQSKSKVPYTLESLKALNSQENYQKDSLSMLSILNAWKRKQDVHRPKAVFLCVSGGGQRAALWSVNGLYHADSVIGGGLMDKTIMITGASGGMVGASYFRELAYRKEQGLHVPDKKDQLKNIGSDNLNPIIFSLLVNDVFLRFRNVRYKDQKYLIDRGYAFESNLNKNLEGVLNKDLYDYKEPERQAAIPMLLMSPVVANDGRKLYLSPHSMSFMNVNQYAAGKIVGKIAGVDFNRLFDQTGADKLPFLTALRMSASFPYITPTVSLPTQPRIEVMDAGISDNYGVGDALKFIETFQQWFEENTAGVVLLIIRDTRKNSPIEPQGNPSLIERVTYPIASVYNNLSNIQDIVNDNQIHTLRSSLGVSLETVELEYNTYTMLEDDYLIDSRELQRKKLERASLSWHLTTRERKNVIENIELPNNQRALRKLVRVLE